MGKDKNITFNVSSDVYAFLKRVCIGAGVTIPTFLRALLQKFALDPERIIAALDDHEK